VKRSLLYEREGATFSNSPPLSLRSPDSVKQPRAAGSVGLSNGVRDGFRQPIMLVAVGKGHCVGGSCYVCWSVGNLVLFEEKENCDVIIHDNVAQSCGSGLRQWRGNFSNYPLQYWCGFGPNSK
jgi:hypothetical protein